MQESNVDRDSRSSLADDSGRRRQPVQVSVRRQPLSRKPTGRTLSLLNTSITGRHRIVTSRLLRRSPTIASVPDMQLSRLRRLMRMALGAALLSGAAGLVVIGSPLPAYATTCDPNTGPSNYFTGYDRVPPAGGYENWEGLSAKIPIRQGGLCGGDGSSNNFYCSWVMLSSYDGRSYMQVGYLKDPGSGPAFSFVEINSETGFIQGPNVVQGDTHQYWLQYDPAAKHEKFNVDNVNLGISHFDPEATWQQPEVPQWISETTYLQNSIPGSPSYPEMYGTILVQRLDSQFSYLNTNLLTPTPPTKATPWVRFVVNSTETETYTE